MSTKRTSLEEALEKIQHYCAYQDRCHQEVRSKLQQMGVFGDDLEAVIVELIAGNFLNEERFAHSFARGKFRMKQWGRTRIIQELKKRSVSEYCIQQGLREIPEEDYRGALQVVLEKKLRTTRNSSPIKRRDKAAAYAIRKGFEPELVWEVLEEVLPGEE